MGRNVGQFERVDRELREALDQLHRYESEDGWTDDEVMGAQTLLIDTAAWLRGARPPRSWAEAWHRIDRLRKAERLRGTGGR